MNAGAPDAELVATVARGNERALGELYDRWSGRVRAVALRITRDEQAAEEIVEDVFWQVWRQAARFDADRASVCAWLMTLARSRSLDRRRHELRRPTAYGDALSLDRVEGTADLSGELEAAETVSRVRSALEELPAEQREVLDLAYYDGLSQTEIADRTGVSLGTVKGRMRLAIQKLRQRILRERRDDR